MLFGQGSSSRCLPDLLLLSFQLRTATLQPGVGKMSSPMSSAAWRAKAQYSAQPPAAGRHTAHAAKGLGSGLAQGPWLLPSPKSRMAVQGLIPANACNPEARTPARTLPSTYSRPQHSLKPNCAVDTVCKLAESHLTTRKSKMLPKMGQFSAGSEAGQGSLEAVSHFRKQYAVVNSFCRM